MDILKSLHADNGLSLVMVTHDLDLAGSSDRIVRMQDGEVVS
jgi:putative ABC transport system ATP-binding protein